MDGRDPPESAPSLVCQCQYYTRVFAVASAIQYLCGPEYLEVIKHGKGSRHDRTSYVLLALTVNRVTEESLVGGSGLGACIIAVLQATKTRK